MTSSTGGGQHGRRIDDDGQAVPAADDEGREVGGPPLPEAPDRRGVLRLGDRRHEAHASGAHAINRVNGLHGRIKEFIDGFHGVATRRLWNYLAWFKRIWSFKRGRTAAQAAGLIVKQAKWDSRARAALPLAMGVVSKVG